MAGSGAGTAGVGKQHGRREAGPCSVGSTMGGHCGRVSRRRGGRVGAESQRTVGQGEGLICGACGRRRVTDVAELVVVGRTVGNGLLPQGGSAACGFSVGVPLACWQRERRAWGGWDGKNGARWSPTIGGTRCVAVLPLLRDRPTECHCGDGGAADSGTGGGTTASGTGFALTQRGTPPG